MLARFEAGLSGLAWVHPDLGMRFFVGAFSRSDLDGGRGLPGLAWVQPD